MPRKIKKSSKKSRSYRTNTNIGDVTLADFANSACPSGKGRLKKATVASVEREVKSLNIKDDDRPWDEKLEDFEGDFEFVEEFGEDGKKVVMRKARRRRKTVTETSCCDVGEEYPLDIWFLLSEYIRPEDVATFACICRSTLHVVSTAKFWFNLYKRYFKKGLKMPERLQPECMVRHYGLRACVIRSLYFMYPPFVAKAKTVMGFEADPHQLIKRQCVLVWHEKFKNQWVFCFKLRRVNYLTEKHFKKPNLMELLDDVFANSEEGCKVLQVTCMNYIPTPMVLGQTLLSVSLTLDHIMRCKLQMVFGSGPRCIVEVGSVPVVLNPVMKVRVLDWWHPLYPHSSDRPQLHDSSSLM